MNELTHCLCCPVCGSDLDLLPPVPQHWMPPHVGLARKLSGAGMNTKGIARVMHTTPSAVVGQLWRAAERDKDFA